MNGNLVSQLINFFWLLLEQWSVLVGGVVACILSWFLPAIKIGGRKFVVTYWIGGFFIFVAMFLVWQQEYWERIAAEWSTPPNILVTYNPVVPSRPDWHGGWEVIVQSQREIIPFGFEIATDAPVVGNLRIAGFYEDYGLRFDGPTASGYLVTARAGIRPGLPWFITLHSKDNFGLHGAKIADQEDLPLP